MNNKIINNNINQFFNSNDIKGSNDFNIAINNNNNFIQQYQLNNNNNINRLININNSNNNKNDLFFKDKNNFKNPLLDNIYLNNKNKENPIISIINFYSRNEG